MILYCDTPALVKLYIAEAHGREVKALAEAAEAVAVCRIAWAEYHAAAARRARKVTADQESMERARQSLAADWRHVACKAVLRCRVLPEIVVCPR